MPTGINTDVFGKRAGAQVLDMVISYGAAFAVSIALAIVLFGGLGVIGAASGGAAPGGGSSLIGGIGLVGALLIGLLNLAIVTGYAVVLELVWDGQTVGKRLLDVRVVDQDGSVPGTGPIVIRNVPSLFVGLTTAVLSVFGPLLVYPLMLLVGAGAILISEDDQRLFDVLAGTYVAAD